MKNRNNHQPLIQRRKKASGWIRLAVFSFSLFSCVVAVALGGLLPSHQLRAFAQLQGGRSIILKPVKKGQGDEQISASVRQQIAALMQEKATRSAGRRKMDSRLIYGIKMERGEQIADGVDTLDVQLPRDEQGQVIVDITANVSKQFLIKLKQVGASVIVSYPQYRSIRVETPLSVVDTIANFPEVIHIQPKQEAMVWQEDTAQGAPSDVNPEHLQRTRPGFEERERNISKRLAKALDDFQLNVYTSANGGVRKSEGDVTHKALLSRNTYGFDGTGIKIGVLSNGVRNLATVQESGDLGPVTVLPGQSGTAAGQCATNVSCDEGTAMLEIVHDIAPGAQLYFATAFPTSAAFAQNIRDLRTAGCDIIVDDIFYFAESPFQDGQAPSVVSPTNGGIVTQAVNDVTADGALYFSSAGNSGNKNDNTSGVWEGDYVDGGPAAAPIGAANGNVHTFPADGTTPTQPFNVVVTAGSSQYNLNWSDPLGGSGNDYDLYALNAAGTAVVTASTSTQDGDDDPFEAIGVTAAGTRLVIVKFTGNARYLRLTTNRGRLTVNTPGQTTGHSTAANAFGVAATPAIGPFPNPFNSTNVVETFSSDGPRRLFFQPDGTPFTAGNVSATGGIVRQKPDITAADGVSVTGAGGFGIQFFGTSAAAPHAAAIAALVKSVNPAQTLAQIRTALNTSAIDIEAAGVDRDSGVGIIMADTAVQATGAAAGAANLTIGTATITDIGGNTNGFIEPGERATLSIPLLNTGINSATTVTATLSSTTPGVVITPSPTRTYADIAATNGTSTNATPFEFVYQEGAVYAADINFVLTVTYNGGIVRSFPFIIPTGRLSNVSTTLDTTAPPTPPEATLAATGTQTGRLNFTFPISTCGTTKANPGTTSTLARRYDSYTYTNTSASTICVSVLLTHSSNVLLHAVAYVPTFVPATPSVNYAGDGGGSTTQGAGTAQLFSFNVNAGQTFTVVVSESNQNGGLGTPYNLRVTGLPAQAVPANQPPVNSVPGAQSTNQGTPLVFTGANAISISDPDAGSNVVQVTLTATNGTFSLGGTTGLTFTPPGPNNDGTNDTQMVFTGTISAINTALNNLTFTPASNFTGNASLTITTNDQGFTGTGGAQSDTDTVNITVTPINILARDGRVAEPATGTTPLVFTVALSAPAGAAVSVNYATANGGATPATGGAACGGTVDYVTASGTLNFAAGEQVKTVSVSVCADATVEPDETFLLNLSGATGGTITGAQAVGTITAANPAGVFLISELRTSGPGGAGDDFVEFYNNTNSPLTVAASDASAGYGVFKMGTDCNATPVLVATIPNGTVIPARGHYLVVGSQYSLANYGGTGAAAGNQTLVSDIGNDQNVAVFSTATLANLSTTTRLDATGFDSNVGGGVCDLLREGNTLPPVSGTTAEHSFFRKECDFVAAVGCTVAGTPKDTNDNAADFKFADTQGTFISGVTQQLGAPGPENLSSPIRRDASIATLLLDSTKTSTVPPNRVRDLTSNPGANSTFGTLSIRRRFTNNTGAAVTRLRFRIVEMTTFPSPGGGVADLRAITSSSVVVSGITDAATCAATGTPTTAPCSVTVQGTTLETPPSQPNGGGFNSSMSAGTITTGTPLANGASINVQFLLGVQTTGTFRFLIIVEALP